MGRGGRLMLPFNIGFVGTAHVTTGEPLRCSRHCLMTGGGQQQTNRDEGGSRKEREGGGVGSENSECV